MDAIETERLIIRPFVMDDLDEAHHVLDMEIRWSGSGFSLKQREDRLKFYMDLSRWVDTGANYGFRAVILKETGQMIGIVGFTPVTWTPRDKSLFWPQLFGEKVDRSDMDCGSVELEVGYALSTRHRGHGYATEASKGLLDYAFKQLRFKRVFATSNRKNPESIRLMERLGMRTAFNPNYPGLDWPGAPGVVGVIEYA